VVAPFLVGRRILVAIVSLSLLPDAFGGLVTAWIKARQRMEVSAAIALGIRLAYLLAGAALLWLGYDERALLGAYAATSLLGALAFGVVLSRWQRASTVGGAGLPGSGAQGDARAPGPALGSYDDAAYGRARYRVSAPETRFLQARQRPGLQGRDLVSWKVLGESMPFAITGIVAMVYARADLLVLSFVQGDAVAGRYGMAYRLWEAMGMVPAALLDALFPELSRLGDRLLDRDRLRVLYRRGWRIVGVGAIWMSAVTQVAATSLMALLFGRSPDASLAVGVLRLLLLAFPFTYLYLLNGHTLYAIGRQRRVTAAMVGVAASKLVMDALIVPRWSTSGAAGVALVSEALLFAWLQFLVWRSLLRSSGAQGRDDLAAGRDDLAPTGASDAQD
jgi:O-antigen/teichoic acid export membrane protein